MTQKTLRHSRIDLNFHQLLLWKFVRMKSSLVQGNLAEYPFIGKENDHTFSHVDPEVEYNNDLLMFGKIQCYVHLIQAQTKEAAESPFFEKKFTDICKTSAFRISIFCLSIFYLGKIR